MECILNQFSDWVDNQSNDRSTDFNLLILPNYYLGPIGLGYIGGDTCIVRGAEMIEDELDTNYPRYQTSNDRTKAAIHEIGHNLSLTHSSNNGGDNGAPPDGRTMLYYWSQLFKIYAVSPHGPPLHEMPVDNECGETQQLAGGSHGETNDFYFYDGCAGNFIQQYNN